MNFSIAGLIWKYAIWHGLGMSWRSFWSHYEVVW